MEKLKMREESPEPERGGCRHTCRFPLLLAPLQLLLGVAVAVVAFLTLSITSSLLARETPHWAGIILLYFILCSVGLVVSVLVVAFAGHHYTQATGFSCERAGPDCVCTTEPQDPIGRTFTYRDVDDCGYLTADLPMFFLVQILLNLAQALVCAAACFIMWKRRYQVFFSGLQISSWQKV
ncbi:sarcospan isoform X2 [Boleophthalmus pectinirostris]|uniref:sarcospan isoform X2 n=1 Tax=Boleophthalmus pectinirostris TaxID=150288 RepID=UPI00242C17BD|nr:sarcospan isoform X2 [Boleophthalmus pectinirostris]